MLLTLKKWLLVPLLLTVVGVVVVVYTVNNPTDMQVANALNYETVSRSLREHMMLILVSMTAAIIVGILGGILLSRPKLYLLGRVVENVVNVGQTIPSLAVLALFFAVIGLGFRVAVFALFLYSILPILRNTFAGIANVESSIIESARGMGMSPYRVLTKIEMPIAFPIIVSGIRTAIVVNVGAATLATFVAAGGLGYLIITGISLQRNMVTFTGAVLAAITALILDYLIGRVEEYVVRWS